MVAFEWEEFGLESFRYYTSLSHVFCTILCMYFGMFLSMAHVFMHSLYIECAK